MMKFLQYGDFRSFPTPRLQDHPMSAVHYCLLNVFAAIIHIWWLFIYPAKHHAILTGTHLLWNNFLVIHNFPSTAEQLK